MTRFTSSLAIATVAFALVTGFGPALTQPAFAKGGHEAAQHETSGGKGDHNSGDKAGTSSADKNGGSVDKGGDKSGSSADKGGDKNGTETEAAETGDK